jgi:hypothetical protein
LEVGYEADLIPEKMLNFISLKENGWNGYGKKTLQTRKGYGSGYVEHAKLEQNWDILKVKG